MNSPTDIQKQKAVETLLSQVTSRIALAFKKNEKTDSLEKDLRRYIDESLTAFSLKQMEPMVKALSEINSHEHNKVRPCERCIKVSKKALAHAEQLRRERE